MNNVFNVITKDAPLRQLDGSSTLFQKQLIRFGDWIDPIFPDDVMTIDRAVLETIVKNFQNGIVGRISVPLTHTDDPQYNAGECVALSIVGDGSTITDGLYGTIDIRRPQVAEDIKNELIWDVSICFTDNYQDNQTGAMYGPTLIHVALVNNPYIKKMNPFTALAEMISKQFGGAAVHMLSESANSNKEITMSKVKNDRDFPVAVTYKNGDEDVNVTLEPGQEVEVPEAAVEGVQKSVSDAPAPKHEETEEEKNDRERREAAASNAADAKKAEDDKALSEGAKAKRELAEAKAKLLDRDIDDTYQTALKAGKIVPAQETAFKALSLAVHGQTRSLSDGKTQNLSELLAEFVAKAPKVVALDDEKGKIDGDSKKGPIEKLSEEERKGLQAMRISDEDYAKYGSRQSVSVNELKKEN